MFVDSLVTITLEPSGEIATPSGSSPTGISANCSPVFGSNTVALASSSLEIYILPFGCTANVSGSEPALNFRKISRELGSITAMESSLLTAI